jgi:hypothetical protein
MSGGYVGILFGDPENYTLTAALLALYMFASYKYLRGKVSVIIPSMALIVAASFHLLSFFLGPSLLYLFWHEIKSGGRRRVIASILLMAGYFAAVLVLFNFIGLPLRNLYYHSHAMGHGGDVIGMLSRPYPWYIYQMINLAFLLAPYFILYLPLLIYKRIGTDPLNRFMSIAALMMFVFLSIWKSLIGVIEDWNLFAITGLPIGLHIWYCFLQIEDMKNKRIIGCALFALFITHSLAWIIANHYNLPLIP